MVINTIPTISVHATQTTRNMVACRCSVVFTEVWSAHAFFWNKTWHHCACDSPNFEEPQVFECLRSSGPIKKDTWRRLVRNVGITQQGGVISQNNALDNYIYILRGFKTSDDAVRLSYSIAFDCSIRPFLDLFHSWLYIFHLSRFSGDGLVFFFLLSGFQ